MLSITTLRLAADLSTFAAPHDVLRDAPPAFWRGNSLRIELGLFSGMDPVQPINLASLTLELRPVGADRSPDPQASPWATQTLTSFDTTVDAAAWADGSKAHAVFTFEKEETLLPPGQHWLVLSALTVDAPARQRTVLAGLFTVYEDGYDAGGAAQTTETLAYSQAESEALFLRQSQNLADLDNPAAARQNLGALSTYALPLGLGRGLRARYYHGGYTILPPSLDTSNLFAEGAEWLVQVHPIDATEPGALLAAGDGTPWKLVLDGVSNGLVRIRFTAAFTGGDLEVQTGHVLPLQATSWLRLSWDGAPSGLSVRLWINDALVPTSVVTPGSGALLSDLGPKHIGGLPTGFQPFHGTVSALRVLNHLLTDAEWLNFLRSGWLPSLDEERLRRPLEVLPNGDFESDVSGWTASAATLSRQTLDPYQGSGYLRVLASNGVTTGAAFQNNVMPVAGQRYRVRAAMRSDGVAVPRLRVGPFGTEIAGGDLGTLIVEGTASTAWTEIERVITMLDPHTAGGRLLLDAFFPGTPADGSQYTEFDAVSVKPLRTVVHLDFHTAAPRHLPDLAFQQHALDTATGVEPWPTPTAATRLSTGVIDVSAARVLFDPVDPVVSEAYLLSGSIRITNLGTAAVSGVRVERSNGSAHAAIVSASGTIHPGETAHLPLLSNLTVSQRLLRVPAVAGGNALSFQFEITRTDHA